MTGQHFPIAGRLPMKGLWINAGHGTLGWTHGAGSGKALAELISGEQPAMAFGFHGMRAAGPRARLVGNAKASFSPGA